MRWKRTKKKKKKEFSKKIFIGVTIGTVIVTSFAMYMSYLTRDTSIFMYLIPAVFTEFATATGFYYWKAKNENVIKIDKNKEEENEWR